MTRPLVLASSHNKPLSPVSLGVSARRGGGRREVVVVVMGGGGFMLTPGGLECYLQAVLNPRLPHLATAAKAPSSPHLLQALSYLHS